MYRAFGFLLDLGGVTKLLRFGRLSDFYKLSIHTLRQHVVPPGISWSVNDCGVSAGPCAGASTLEKFSMLVIGSVSFVHKLAYIFSFLTSGDSIY